jgi:hypothetical protein
MRCLKPTIILDRATAEANADWWAENLAWFWGQVAQAALAVELQRLGTAAEEAGKELDAARARQAARQAALAQRTTERDAARDEIADAHSLASNSLHGRDAADWRPMLDEQLTYLLWATRVSRFWPHVA